MRRNTTFSIYFKNHWHLFHANYLFSFGYFWIQRTGSTSWPQFVVLAYGGQLLWTSFSVFRDFRMITNLWVQGFAAWITEISDSNLVQTLMKANSCASLRWSDPFAFLKGVFIYFRLSKMFCYHASPIFHIFWFDNTVLTFCLFRSLHNESWTNFALKFWKLQWYQFFLYWFFYV